jgi:uncharacterized membrane-anchored protein YjiN (DUF445 family)
MRYINKLEFKIDDQKEHILFLEKLLKTLCGEGWNILTVAKAKTLTTISKHDLKETLSELKQLVEESKPPENYKDITHKHIHMVNDIIETLGAAPAYSQKAKDILLQIKSKASIRTVVVVPKG